MRTIIVASRTIHNPRPILDAIAAADLVGITPTVVLSTDSVGGDKIAVKWAIDQGLIVKIHDAEWSKNGAFARTLRNKHMAEHADAVIAIRHWNDADYVDDMVRPAREQGLLIVEWTA